MHRSRTKRALGSLKRLLRRRRAPAPSEQEWLRLILLVRRIQGGQLAVAQRLDDIRSLTSVLGSFRSEVGALNEQLGAARFSAGELERGLSERAQTLGASSDPDAERAALDQRLGALDALAARLEQLACQPPSSGPLAGDLGSVVEALWQLAARFEAVQAAERAVGGQDELARLYERIQELAERVARRPPPDLSDSAFAREAGAQLAGIADRLTQLEAGVQALGSGAGPAQEKTLARLEQLVRRLARRGGGSADAGSAAAEELIPLLARFEALALRLEQSPASLPELPPETIASESRALEELRVKLLCEQESRRRVDVELEGARERLRGSELARVELEARHTTELAQVADHVGRQLQRVEADLKRKKSGLAELTQQNIALQTELGRLRDVLEKSERTTAPLARGPSLSRLMHAEPSPDPAPDGKPSV